MTGPRRLDWPNCVNVRDLAGLRIGNGGRIRVGALIRSDNLSRLTEAGIAAVRAADVSRIIDVRTPDECCYDPDPFAGEPIYRNLPLAKAGDTYDPALPIEQDYAVMLDRNPDLFAAALAAIAEAPPGAVLVHCHSGKDRSGVVIALALSLAGVNPDLIAADYAVLTRAMQDHFDRQLETVADPAQRALLGASFTAEPETMLSVLRHLEESYDGVETYLRRGGLSAGRVETLRSRLRD